jgi:hypothetical protein
MTLVTSLDLSDQALRARLLAELHEQGLALPEKQEELVMRMCLSAYREDVLRALSPCSGSA